MSRSVGAEKGPAVVRKCIKSTPLDDDMADDVSSTKTCDKQQQVKLSPAKVVA